MENVILTINGGSSSIKFALYSHPKLAPILSGSIERIGLPNSTYMLTKAGAPPEERQVAIADIAEGARFLQQELARWNTEQRVIAIGHRVVYGVGRSTHALITDALLEEFRASSPIDPEHMPGEIALIELFRSAYPEAISVACFDTVFHHDMPRVSSLLSFPRHFTQAGLRRFGFHGLSCAYLIEELRKIEPELADGRIIVAHLGSGSSITAIRGGKTVDTSMGFTPTSGIPMSSRSGDVDPGALLYIMEQGGFSVGDMRRMVNQESGLIGISETTVDMRDLLDREHDDPRAKDAVDLFCYEARKRIGAYAFALGGLDAIIFSGGIGERAPRIRDRILHDGAFLGIDLDHERNEHQGPLISSDTSPVHVRVMHTDEEMMIARITSTFISQ